MISRQSSNSGLWRLPLFIVLLLACFYILWRDDEPTTSEVPLPDVRSAGVSPLEQAIATTKNVSRPDSIAIAVLVDVTASMADRPARSSESKIDSARKCAVNLVKQVRNFAEQDKGRGLEVGIYEFSWRGGDTPNCRVVLPLGRPDDAAAQRAVPSMQPDGAQCLGDALVFAKRDLDAAAVKRSHILVITDGDPATENSKITRYFATDVMAAIGKLPEEGRPAVYLVAFDVAVEIFNTLKAAGVVVMPAGNTTELQRAVDEILTKKILAGPTTAGK